MQAIRNADHVELFSRADFISKKTNKQRVTISQADDRGGVALTTRFSDKDSVIQPVSIIEKKASLSYASGDRAVGKQTYLREMAEIQVLFP